MSDPFTPTTRNEAARLITEHVPGDLSHVFFTNGGAGGAITLTGDPRRWPSEPGYPGVVHFVPDLIVFAKGVNSGYPLFHDAITPSEFHREWWDRYRRVNERFADAAASAAERGATVWVRDYQLLLVPGLLTARRRD